MHATVTARRSRRTTLLGLSAVLLVGLAGSPALADKDHNNGRGNDDRVHAEKARKDAQKEADKLAEQRRKAAEKEARKQTCVASWSPASAGRPVNLSSRSATGLYVWHDDETWNVVATGNSRNSLFQGTITFNAPASIDTKHLERGSDIVLTSANQATFILRNHGRDDQVKLRSTCASSITIAGTLNGQPITAQQFFVGRAGGPAATSPFIEQRTVTQPVVTLPTLPAPTLPAVTSTTVAACPTPAAWNVNYTGQPGNLRAGAAAGLYLWIDGDRIRLSTTRPNSTPSMVSGSITVNAPALSVTGKDLNPNDVLTPQANGATFTFNNTGGIDGLELRSPCATQVIVTAVIDGQPVVPQQVWIGRNAFTPSAIPVVLSR